MDQLKKVLAVLLLNCFIIASHCAEQCFECTDAPYPRDCSKVTVCGDDEYCSVEQVVKSSGTVLYNSGCLSRSRCQALGHSDMNVTGSSIIRRGRGTDIVTCIECCAGKLCNNEGCGTSAIPPDQRGPYCFSCDATLDPLSCHTVTLCSPNEQCLLYTPLEFSSYPEIVYTGACESATACATLSSTFQNSRCPPRCCSDDFCNTECGVRNATIMSTPEAQTVTVPITTVFSTVQASASGAGIVTTTLDTPIVTNPVVITTTNAGNPQAITCDINHFYDDLTQACIRIVNTPMTFEEARQACNANGERLVVIDTHAKMVFVENMLIRHSGLDIKSQFYWIGLRRQSLSDPFTWLNGQQLQTTYWGGHDEVFPNEQPDNTGLQYCVVIVGEDHYMWHDDVCTNLRPFVCEISSESVVTTIVPPTHTCDTSDGYIALHTGSINLCVKVHKETRDWDTARTTCTNEGADLVILDSSAKAILLKDEVSSLHAHESFWIGAKDFSGGDVFEWVDSTPVDLNNGDWNPGQPNHFDGGHIQDCANMWSPDDLRWHDDMCAKHLGFVCERKL